jgi:hypothetical protein
MTLGIMPEFVLFRYISNGSPDPMGIVSAVFA